VALAGVLALPGYPQAVITPPPGDLEVFYAYLRQVHLVVEQSRQQTQGAPEKPAAPERSAAARLGIELDDLPAIGKAYQRVTAMLEQVDAEGRAYAEETVRLRKRPIAATVRGFSARRYHLVEQARTELRRDLGAAAWRRVESVIDGEFRMRIQRRAFR